MPLQLWFARILRDGFAATMAETFTPFPDIAKYHVRAMIECAVILNATTARDEPCNTKLPCDGFQKL